MNKYWKTGIPMGSLALLLNSGAGISAANAAEKSAMPNSIAFIAFM